MKAILSYSLYRRPKATNEEDAIGYLSAGSVIEVSRIEAGKMLDGISIWFFAEDGFYYWGGGIQNLLGEGFFSWNNLPLDTQHAVLSSIVNDEAYLIEKRVIGSLGYSLGYKNDDISAGLALSIFVGEKTPEENLEKTITYKGILDIPVDVKEAEEIIHDVFPNIMKQITPDMDIPMQMGGSISLSGSKSVGSRGLILEREEKSFLLTCFHVLLGEFIKKGIFPFSGSPNLSAEYPSSQKNPHGVRIRKGQITEGRYDNNSDFALVQLNDEFDLLNAFDNRLFNDFHDSNTREGLLHKNVIMAGAVSIMQQGKVLETDGSVTITKTGMRFRNVVVTEKISAPGDSGGPVVDENNKVVGIIIASDKRNRSYVLPIHNFLILEGYKIN